MVPAVELERRVHHAGVFCVIINKFCHGSQPCLIVLFVINEGFKVSFYYAVLPLSLAVNLRIEDSREPPFNAQEVVQRGRELRCEY